VVLDGVVHRLDKQSGQIRPRTIPTMRLQVQSYPRRVRRLIGSSWKRPIVSARRRPRSLELRCLLMLVLRIPTLSLQRSVKAHAPLRTGADGGATQHVPVVPCAFKKVLIMSRTRQTFPFRSA
jgi:hypothetical protein